ncbi:MAG: hypothetical protein R6U44_11855 [Archaeoglobaceae archaeon]
MKASDNEFIDLKYWKEVTEEVGSLVTGDWNVMLLTHDSMELKDTIHFFKELSIAKRIVYISLTRTCNHIRPYFKEPYFNKDSRVFVIDCVSRGVFGDKDQNNSGDCIFVNPPSNMEKIQKLIGKSVEKISPQYVILDSLSHLIEFLSSEGKALLPFFNFLRNLSPNCKFILLYDTSYGSKNVPKAYVDIILNIEEDRNLVFWKD